MPRKFLINISVNFMEFLALWISFENLTLYGKQINFHTCEFLITKLIGSTFVFPLECLPSVHCLSQVLENPRCLWLFSEILQIEIYILHSNNLKKKNNNCICV